MLALIRMGNALRNQPFPSIFPELKTSPTYNSQSAVNYAYLSMIAVSFFLILPGIRGLQRCWTLLRVYTAVWIAGVLLICNYSAWYGDTICTRTQYKAYTGGQNVPQEIEAEVGLHISLRGINITVSEKDCGFSSHYISPFPDETINYNEHFSWSNPWGQGRQDFGKYGGKFRQQFREAKYRGVPYPIAWIAEYFIIDGEQIRWYRKFRQAGWYTHIIMWLAFTTHLFSILIFTKNIRIGTWHLAMTGSLMLLACLSYSTIILNDPILQIHFPDDTLTPCIKPAFWVTLGTGLATVLIACTLLILEMLIPLKMAELFNMKDDSFFEVDEEITQSFAQMSLMKQKSDYRPSLRGAVKRRTKRLSKRKSRDSYVSQEVCKQPKAKPTYSDNEKEDSSVTMRTISSHDQPEIEVLNDITHLNYFTRSGEQQIHKLDNTLSVMTSHDLEMEIQVAEIILK